VFDPKSRIVSETLVQTDLLLASVAPDGCRVYTVGVLVVFELSFPLSLAFPLLATARDELIIVLAVISTYVFNKVMTWCVLCVMCCGRGARWGRPMEVELGWTGAQVLADKQADRGPAGVSVILNNSLTPVTLYHVGMVHGRLGHVTMSGGGTVHVCLVHGGCGLGLDFSLFCTRRQSPFRCECYLFFTVACSLGLLQSCIVHPRYVWFLLQYLSTRVNCTLSRTALTSWGTCSCYTSGLVNFPVLGYPPLVRRSFYMHRTSKMGD
jgi:hypothetical protein